MKQNRGQVGLVVRRPEAVTGKVSLAHPTCRGFTGYRPVPHRAAGYLLLEVMISVVLLVLGLATIGAQLQRSYDTARDSRRVLRAINLAQSKLAELDARLVPDLEEAFEDDLEEEFGRLFPEWAWRLRLEPTQTEELWSVRLDILYQRREDIDDEDFDFEEGEVVYSLYTLRATPATIDPARDFGADEETMQTLMDAFGGTDFDPSALDPRILAGLPLEDLIDIMGALREAGLLQGVDLSAVLPPEIFEMVEEALGEAGTDGAPEGGEGG